MDDLESRLEHELSGLGRVPLAEPEPIDDLRRRARRVRTSRALMSVVAIGTAALLVGSIAIATRDGSHATTPHKVFVAAPSFVLGDIDAVVLSTKFDSDGARATFPPALAAIVSRVPGVQSVSGVIDTFAPVMQNPDGSSSGGQVQTADGGTTPSSPPTSQQTPPRTPVLFSYHQDDALHIDSGRAPKGPGEILVDADFIDREHVAVGGPVSLEVQGRRLDFTIVGTFSLPGVPLAGIPLAAIPASLQPQDLQIDRLDVNLAPGANGANVRDAIAVATGNDYNVVQPGVISVPDQRLAQLEIQHAYWALLSPDPTERSTSGVGPANAKEHANYEKYASVAQNAELRVENVTFLSADAAALTYRIYYGGGPSPIINEPQAGTATRVNGHWQLGTSTLCSLAALVGIKCTGKDAIDITPPNGYQPLTTLDPELKAAFTALANPDATVAERVAAIQNGAALRSLIAAGLQSDRQYSGRTDFSIVGWQPTKADGSEIQILFSLQTTDGPSTPWPSNAVADKATDGHWYVSQAYSCGILGFTSGTCGPAGSGAIIGSAPPAGLQGTPTTAIGQTGGATRASAVATRHP